MNCKEFHTEVEAGLKDTRLSASAQQHAADCPPCHEFNNEHVEFREWLTVCQKITAPKDFQFGVQRKIANTGSANSQDRIWRGLRYIVPSAGMAAVLALGISYGVNYQNVDGSQIATSISNTSQFAPKDSAVPAPSADQQQALVSIANVEKIETPPATDNDKTMAASNAAKPENNSRAAVPKENQKLDGGSIESGVKDSKESKLPEGIKLPTDAASNLSNTLVSAARLGVIAGTDRRVNRVTGAAEKAGVQIGDIVESVSGNTVTVSRGGQKMTFKL